MIDIIIPSVKAENLRACLESIEKYTDLELVRVIAVCNGMKDKGNLPSWVTTLDYPEMLGYAKACNEGIRHSTGDFIILLNDDALLLPQPKNQWLDMLLAPFSDPKMGLTGPIKCNGSFVVFFCVMISRACLQSVGMLDENFGVGGGEDADYYIRATKLGWKSRQVPGDKDLDFSSGLGVGAFQIYHKGESTVHDRDYVKNWVEICNKNCDYLEFKHPGNGLWRKYPLKLNLACGPKNWHMAGYTNIDLYEPGADLQLDIRDLSRFANDSVDEIYAGHVIEHFDPGEIQPVLTEWWRVLKPGGKFALECPDIEACCRAFINQPERRFELLTTIYGAVQGVKVPHLYGYTFEILRDLLYCVGFDGMVKMPQQFWHQGENMRVECVKGEKRGIQYFR